MRIALINENSQAAKNGIVLSALTKVVEPMGHVVDNYGMYAADDAAQLTYVQVGILGAILLNSGAADYVVKGCPEEEVLRHLRMAARGEAQLESRIQQTVLREYSRLQRSEQSLLFFINMVSQLTPAERALVRCLLDDKKVREIAQMRCVELVTVKTQIKSLLRKFGCSRTKEIVQLVRQLKLDHLF